MPNHMSDVSRSALKGSTKGERIRTTTAPTQPTRGPCSVITSPEAKGKSIEVQSPDARLRTSPSVRDSSPDHRSRPKRPERMNTSKTASNTVRGSL